MNRREFIKRGTATGLAVAGSALGATWLYDPRSGAEYFREKTREDVRTLPSFYVDRGQNAVSMTIAHGQNVDALVRAAIGEMGGITDFIQKGDVVLLKPNVAFDRAPLLGATTNPRVLSQVFRLRQLK